MSTKALSLSRTAKARFSKDESIFGRRRLDEHAAPLSAFRSAVTWSPASLYQPPRGAGFSSTSRSCERLGQRAKEKLVDREFFLSLLSSASTKREAKQYLSRFKNGPKTASTEQSPYSATSSVPSLTPSLTLPHRLGVNIGSFYGSSRSVYDTPVFAMDPNAVEATEEVLERLHLALVKIATPQSLDDFIIDGVAKTLSQLTRLGMSCCVVVDPGVKADAAASRKIVFEQVNRISRAVEAQPSSKSRFLDSIFSIGSSDPSDPKVLSRRALLNPLRSGQVVVVAPVAYTEDSPRAVILPTNDVILALAKEFSGLSTSPDPDEDPLLTANRIDGLQMEVALDRVIVLDQLGGIPAYSGPQKSHVFVNLVQEFNDIQSELLRAKQMAELAGETSGEVQTSTISISQSNPLSNFSNAETAPGPHLPQDQTTAFGRVEVLEKHLENLRLAQKALSMLPSSSSVILTSPTEVADSAQPSKNGSDFSSVSTRRQRNPLIHNLLTDKPLLSSSLPLSRRSLGKWSPGVMNRVTAPTTLIKRGMPLTLFPDPRVQVWSADSRPRVRLDDPSIDLSRLVNLIEDSFNRKLDVQDYLNRVNDRIAGLIIAGEYEGGAILTWEAPPGVADDGSAASIARMVPYLDKFAVLKRSQGAGGVADIVFNAMVRICFSNGVCWRSRKDNPVNKWYFERSQGTWALSESNWIMFWTTPGLPENLQMLRDYEAVCRSIQPSWADNKSVID